VGGFESDGFSATELVVTGSVVEVAGDSLTSSLTGVSSFFSDSGSTMARSF
jgi:hypothetical protein